MFSDTVVRITHTPADFIASVINTFIYPGLGINGPNTFDCGVASVEGMPAIYVELSDEDFGFDTFYYTTLGGVTDGVVVPAEILFIAPGWSQTVSSGEHFGPVYGSDELYARWGSLIEVAIVPFIEGVTNAVVDNVLITTHTLTPLWRHHLMAQIRVVTPAGSVLTMTIGVTFPGGTFDSGDEFTYTVEDVGEIPSMSAALNVVTLGKELQQIADATTEMANQENNISLNNNAAIFSAKSKVITGS